MWQGGVRVIIPDEKNRILMVRQCHEGRDIWMAPGGAVENGETADQAGVREVLEETGLHIKIKKLIWHVEQVGSEKERFVNFFLGERISGTLTLGQDPERNTDEQVLQEVRFMSKKEIGDLELLYPRYLKDEIWRFLEGDLNGYNPFKLRE